MTAATLLDELRQLGATAAVVDGRLRIAAPRGRLTAELRESLTRHKAELRALLEKTVPAQDPHRLSVSDCLAALDAMDGEIRNEYVAGALALLTADRDLARRFEATEARIDELTQIPGGPLEADFRAAIADHGAVWREVIARQRAQQERREEAAAMPELPDDTAVAIGFSYADDGPGTWESMHTSTHARGERR